jgi:hypothetical protein
MSRYKGRQSAKAVEQDYSHFVDMLVPPGAARMFKTPAPQLFAELLLNPEQGQASRQIQVCNHRRALVALRQQPKNTSDFRNVGNVHRFP